MPRTTPDKVTIISSADYEPLARKVAAEMQIPFTEIERKTFKDGEIYHRLPVEKIDGRDVVIVSGTHNDASYMEAIDLIEGAHNWHAASIGLVVPYLGYSTMERAKKDSGEIAKGITRTRRLLRQPLKYAGFIDLHAEGVMNVGHPSVDVEHYETDDLVVEQILALKIDNLALVSPDYGRSKWVANIAKKAKIPFTSADKSRFAHDEVIVGQVSPVVKGRVALICDDMIRTAGSIGQTADRCVEAGAVRVGFQATNLILAGEARQILTAANPRIVLGADTCPGVVSDELVTIYSVAGLIAQKLRKHFGF